MSATAALWFERLSARLSLPSWAGAVVFGSAPFLGTLAASYVIAGLWADFLAAQLIGMPILFIFTTYLLLAAPYVCRRIANLAAYAQSLSEGDSAPALRGLYGLRGVLIMWALIEGTMGPLFAFFGYTPQYSSVQLLLTNLPWIYWSLLLSTFLWVWVYAMISIYRIGKLPLQLKPFTEDRTLGLKPFATASLQLTVIYLLVAILFVGPLFLAEARFAGQLTLPFLITFLVLLVLGVAFFILPLRSLRSKLLQAKREKLAWIGRRYTQIVWELEARGDGPLDERLVSELTAVRSIQQDVQQIRTWPFDTGILVRLTAIVVSVVAIVSARIIQALLQL